MPFHADRRPNSYSEDMDIDSVGGDSASKRKAANLEEKGGAGAPGDEPVVPSRAKKLRLVPETAPPPAAAEEYRREVRAAGEQFVQHLMNTQTPAPEQGTVYSAAGGGNISVPSGEMGNISGIGSMTAEGTDRLDQNQHGPMNMAMSVLPISSMTRYDPWMYAGVFDGIPRDRQEQFVWAKQEPIWVDRHLAGRDPACPNSEALLSTQALNMVLLVNAKRAREAAKRAAADPSKKLAKHEHRITHGEFSARYYLLGYLSNLSNPGPGNAGERSVQMATITHARLSQKMPNFWQFDRKHTLARAFLGFKLELCNMAQDVPLECITCAESTHSPYAAANPMPDQTLHKVRRGPKGPYAKDDDIIAFQLLPQVFSNPKGISNQIACVDHGDTEENGYGLWIFFGTRDSDNQDSGTLTPAHVMFRIVAPLSDEVAAAKADANDRIGRISCFIKQGLYQTGALLPPAYRAAVFPEKNRTMSTAELVHRIRKMTMKESDGDGAASVPPPRASAASSSAAPAPASAAASASAAGAYAAPAAPAPPGPLQSARAAAAPGPAASAPELEVKGKGKGSGTDTKHSGSKAAGTTPGRPSHGKGQEKAKNPTGEKGGGRLEKRAPSKEADAAPAQVTAEPMDEDYSFE